MKTITETIYLRAEYSQYRGEYDYSIASYEMDSCITLDSMEVSMEIPEDFDLNTAHIDILEAEKQKIQAEAHIKAENIEE